MAVDRNAVAWVNYVASDDSQGVLYRVSTVDASCEASPVVTLPDDWHRVGMGYSMDSASAATETLFLASDSGGTSITINGDSGTSNHKLGRLDAASLALVPIDSFQPFQTYQSLDAELTGTGDGRLYGFFIGTALSPMGGITAPIVGQLDKASANVASPATMTGVQEPTDYAFAFWGGHFYLFVSQGSGSNVVDYDPVSGSVNASYMTSIGFDIVGAGVSTCAPVVPPPPPPPPPPPQ
jgi:hypothetical protein